MGLKKIECTQILRLTWFLMGPWFEEKQSRLKKQNIKHKFMSKHYKNYEKTF